MNLTITKPEAPLKSELQRLRESYSDVELTEFERETALAQAREKKHFHLNSVAYRDKMRREELARMQNIPAEAMELRAWNYIVDTLKIKAVRGGEFERVLKLLALYFSSDARFETGDYSLTKGLMLWGKIGCGKTTLMRAFYLNPKQSYSITKCSDLVKQFRMEGAEGIEPFMTIERDRIGGNNYFAQQYMGRCFDDLGTEDLANSFGNKSNVMADIILSRYDSCVRYVDEKRYHDLTHITTNLNTEEIEKEYGPRFRSRAREMFNLIEFDYSKSKDMRR